MNQLSVTYKYGHQRVVNLDQSFFNDSTPSFNHQTKKLKIMSPDTKAIELANYLDKDPYIIELVRDGRVVINHTYPHNKPVEYGIK